MPFETADENNEKKKEKIRSYKKQRISSGGWVGLKKGSSL